MAQFDDLVDAFREKAETVIQTARDSAAELDALQKELRELSKQITDVRKSIGKQATTGRKPRTPKVTQPQYAAAE